MCMRYNNTNRCPVGITTNDPRLGRGFDPEDKYVKVANYGMVLQREILVMLKSMGVRTPWELSRRNLSVVTEPLVSKRLSDLHPYVDGSDGKRNVTLGPPAPVMRSFRPPFRKDFAMLQFALAGFVISLFGFGLVLLLIQTLESLSFVGFLGGLLIALISLYILKLQKTATNRTSR